MYGRSLPVLPGYEEWNKQHRQAATLLFSVVAARLESEVAVFLCLISTIHVS